MTATTTDESSPTTGARPGEPAAPAAEDTDSGALVEGDLLVEDVSIDGMCGVY